jgi:hypothetical protein
VAALSVGGRTVRSVLRTRPAYRVRADLRVVLPLWVVARVVVAAALGTAHVLFDELASPGQAEPDALRLGLVAWDGSWYRDIAVGGYDATSSPDQGLRFFPLFPLLGRALAAPFGGGTTATSVALVVIANLAALVVGVLLLRTVRHELGRDRADGGEALARRAVGLLFLAPPAAFLVLGYAEPLMLVLVLVALGAVRRDGPRRWWVAAGAAYLAGLTRPFGVLLAPALAWELGCEVRGRDGTGAPATARDWAARLAAIAGAPLGLATYLAWVGSTHDDAFLPVSVQRDEFRGDTIDPIRSLWRTAGEALDGDANRALHLAWAVVLIGLVVVVVARLPVSWSVLAVGTVLVALSAEHIDSLERYGLSAFPVVVAAALVLDHPRLDPWRRHVWPLCGAGLALYATTTFLGGYVP